MILLLGSAKRFPFAPAAKRNAAMLAQMPTQIVETSLFTKFIVS
jgi:hypothetical protein